MPLDNFPSQLQDLINLDVIALTSKYKDTVMKNCSKWKNEAFNNLDKIGKLGSKQTEQTVLALKLNEFQESSFIKAVKLFNERNYYILYSLANNDALENDERVIKSQMFLSTFKGINLSIPKEININEDFDYSKNSALTQPVEILKIQSGYLQRFIDSLSIHTFDIESSIKLASLLNGEAINTDIKFACPANSVINFFRKMTEEGIILNNKEISGRFIRNHFLFNWRNKFNYPTSNNIVNYLTRSDPPTVLTIITLVK